MQKCNDVYLIIFQFAFVQADFTLLISSTVHSQVIFLSHDSNQGAFVFFILEFIVLLIHSALRFQALP